ncbi:type IV secretion system protein VirB10 [Silvibacterium bohemicum]|uniref:Type IV secretion system protein VirB10 n=2 Tax=Silvibacterium bohemicum TaxID=1577686 RepID=A0A841JU93_9BACT|nr:hypothetical protein [Silvibacterium bohemicum]MBB6144962.1 type IV secretion system protein VirB10 [Silvibacterium bohemicum]
MKFWVLATALTSLTCSLPAQTAATPAAEPPAAPNSAAPTQTSAAPISGSAAPASASPASAVPAQPDAPAVDEKAVVIPAGSKILLALKSAVDTKTAQPGDPVYLTSTFPVVVRDRVVIPAGMDVQGVVDSVVRPGRVKGRAQITMHFTTLILPNGSVVGIPGSVNAVPGANGPTVKGKENTIVQPGGNIQDARNVGTATTTGAAFGGLATLTSGNVGAGVGIGAAAGLGGGVIYTLMTRGKDVVLQVGQPLEMALQRPLILDQKDVYVPPTPTGVQFVPSPNQPKPLPKPQPPVN